MREPHGPLARGSRTVPIGPDISHGATHVRLSAKRGLKPHGHEIENDRNYQTLCTSLSRSGSHALERFQRRRHVLPCHAYKFGPLNAVRSIGHTTNRSLPGNIERCSRYSNTVDSSLSIGE